MKIKQAAAKCGLTEKAIRLYEEKGLISPLMTEINGRMFRDYDEETVSRLQTISALRRAFFSIDQIAEILDHPENIPAVFASYRDELHNNYTALKPLLEHAEEINPADLSSAAEVSAAMTAPGAHGVSEQALPTLHFRVWNEEQSRDEREIAYARCQQYIAHWGRFYGAYLVFDTVCEWIGRSFKVITAVLAGLVMLALILYYVPFPVRTIYETTGYEITVSEDIHALTARRDSFHSVEEIENYDISILPDPTDPVKRTICFDGWVLRYALREDVFIGDMTVSGYESTRFSNDVFDVHHPNDMVPDSSRYRIYTEGEIQSWFSSVDKNHVRPVRLEHDAMISQIYIHENSIRKVIQMTVASAGYVIENGEIAPSRIMFHLLGGDRYIFLPAETPEEAKRLYYEYDWKPREIRIFENRQKQAAEP
ncbi:MAG: MerR family transcriptional regulator [Clostridia bacterium]|nr:MerR family transcriptional regulator [Clostridia bacterium]